MCCGTGSHHTSGHCGPHFGGHHHASSRGCGGTVHVGRCFPSKEEQLAWLERYLEGLRAEAQGVEERIAQMKEE
jgi:hypothetical protein